MSRKYLLEQTGVDYAIGSIVRVRFRDEWRTGSIVSTTREKVRVRLMGIREIKAFPPGRVQILSPPQVKAQ